MYKYNAQVVKVIDELATLLILDFAKTIANDQRFIEIYNKILMICLDDYKFLERFN